MDAHQTLHPSDQTLRSYGLGKLDDGSAEAVSKHLEQCQECRNRVAELSPDTFLGRLRVAQGRPDSPARSVDSLAGLAMLAAGSPSPAPPATGSLPPGLADHPDYEILRELGQGGMGVVYLAENKLMSRKEVLKVVGSHLVNRRGVLDRFLAEIRHAAQLHHPNIVTAYAALRMGESLVLTMEYVEGLDLAKLVKARGPLPVANACYYAHQAALALQHAHEHGMVHRDIKPGNLMLAPQGYRAAVKVLDFGLAKVSREVPADGALTYEGQMLGTPDFIAPEQSVDARSADIRADIYSLGCTLYYLLTGGPPFQGTSLYDVLQAHHSREALPLNLARPEVPVELAALVGKMMAKEPERRFQEPKEVAQALVPFFKPGANPGSRSSPDVSLIAQAASAPQPVGGGSAPAQPATLRAAPATAPLRPSKPNPEGVAWERLIELGPPEAEKEPVAAVKASKRQRPPRMWPSIIAASMFGVISLGVIIYVTTNYGRIKITVEGPKADVQVDGEQILINTPRESITLRAGPHKLAVKWCDAEFKTRNFVVHRGKDEELHVEYEPKVSDRAGTDRQTSPPTERDSSDSAEGLPELPTSSSTGVSAAPQRGANKTQTTPVTSIDLLSMIDIRRHTTRGKWQRLKTTLVSVAGEYDVIQVPYQPPEEYRLDIMAERVAGRSDFQVGIFFPKNRCILVLDGWGGEISGITWIDGKGANQNETTYLGHVFADAGPTHLVVTVRKQQLQVTANEQPIIDWRGSESRLAPRDDPGTGRRSLFLAVQNAASYRIDAVKLTPLSEPGKDAEVAKPP